MELKPREILTKILDLECANLLKLNGFTFFEASSQFKRKLNKIDQMIYFEGNRWNRSNTCVNYKMRELIYAPEYPKWYLHQYNTLTSNHHQVMVSKCLPAIKRDYLNNWNDEAQVHGEYDLIHFPFYQISESLYKNLEECIIPYLNQMSTYSGIASLAVDPLDSFDFYMMGNQVDSAKKMLLLRIKTLVELKIDELDLNNEFVKNFLANVISMVNIRIDLFFPDISHVSIPQIS
jgi:hypothetical protein